MPLDGVHLPLCRPATGVQDPASLQPWVYSPCIAMEAGSACCLKFLQMGLVSQTHWDAALDHVVPCFACQGTICVHATVVAGLIHLLLLSARIISLSLSGRLKKALF